MSRFTVVNAESEVTYYTALTHSSEAVAIPMQPMPSMNPLSRITSTTQSQMPALPQQPTSRATKFIRPFSNLFRRSSHVPIGATENDLGSLDESSGGERRTNSSVGDPPTSDNSGGIFKRWRRNRRERKISKSANTAGEIQSKQDLVSETVRPRSSRWLGVPIYLKPSSFVGATELPTGSDTQPPLAGSTHPPPDETRDPLLVSVPISKDTAAPEVVACLLEHGCQDLTRHINLASFEEYPIAIGGSSDIYCGRLSTGEFVAVKTLRVSAQSLNGDRKHLKHAARELHMWNKCSHPNVIPLLGLATFRGRIGMVSPWMGKGNIVQYLSANQNADRGELCVQVCEGLTYLHETGVIHGDLKGDNVLVSDAGVAVLTDFGNATLKDQSIKFTQTVSSSALTVRWSAPELIDKTGASLRTKASDVYALGMTLYEILTGKVPYYKETEPAAVILLIVRKVPPERPKSTPNSRKSESKLWELFVHCWAYEPGARPSVALVTETMRTMSLEGMIHLAF